MNKKIATTSITTLLLALPILALAWAPDAQPNQLNPNITQLINGIIGFVWPMVAIGVVAYFIIVGFMFFMAQGKPEELDKARKALMWGVVGVVVILMSFSILSIVRFSINVA